TYPLPESQLDRFLLRIAVGYPDRDDELQVLTSHRGGEPIERLRPVIDGPQVVALQHAVRQVTMDESINSYLLDIVDATRRNEELRVGVSTRGALCLYRASQALALVEYRDFVIPDDIKRLAVPVLSHRVIAKGYLQGTQRNVLETLIARLVEEIPVPR
ncbi:MAG TPA: MoxR family ATPase, partial [Pirellulales bacterium]|nr:MoxR family ATPase [Pirellulales bacterium]